MRSRILHHRSSRRSQAGFTLVELMVSVILMSLVVIAVFSFFNSMSNVFHTQEQVVDVQSDVRFATEFIAKDIRRSGYLAAPSAAADPLVCPKPAAAPTGLQYSATWVVNDDANASVFGGGADGAANTNIFPDSLFVMGSMEVSQAFELSSVTTGQASLKADSIVEVFGSDDAANNEARFNALFKADRMVKVYKPDGRAQFGFISEATWNAGAPTVTLTGLVAREGNRGCGLEGISGEDYELSVLNIMRYRVEQSASDPSRSDLLRAEMNPKTGAVMAGTEISILDHVVDFQVWPDVDKGIGAVPNMAPDQEWGDDIGNETWTNMVGQWHRARALHVTISARTPREDPTLLHEPRAIADGGTGDVFGPLLTFNADTDAEGAAHVVTMSTTVELRNLSLRNLH